MWGLLVVELVSCDILMMYVCALNVFGVCCRRDEKRRETRGFVEAGKLLAQQQPPTQDDDISSRFQGKNDVPASKNRPSIDIYSGEATVGAALQLPMLTLAACLPAPAG